MTSAGSAWHGKGSEACVPVRQRRLRRCRVGYFLVATCVQVWMARALTSSSALPGCTATRTPFRPTHRLSLPVRSERIGSCRRPLARAARDRFARDLQPARVRWCAHGNASVDDARAEGGRLCTHRRLCGPLDQDHRKGARKVVPRRFSCYSRRIKSYSNPSQRMLAAPSVRLQRVVRVCRRAAVGESGSGG